MGTHTDPGGPIRGSEPTSNANDPDVPGHAKFSRAPAQPGLAATQQRWQTRASSRRADGSTEHPGVPSRAPQERINYQTHCFWVEEVVVFVPSLCWVVVLLLDCPVWGFDIAALSVVLDGSTVVVRLSFCPVGCSVVVVFEFVWANAGPRTTMHPKAASAASREIDLMLPPVSTPQRHSIRMATTRRASGITKGGLDRQGSSRNC